MTEDERKKWYEAIVNSQECSIEKSETSCSYVNNWYLQHNFDVNGLITKGVAIEAPEGMYEKKV